MTLDKKDVKRRDFIKGAVAGVGVGVFTASGMCSYAKASTAPAKKRKDIGLCRSVKVTTISETSWFDNATLLGDIKNSGGVTASQYTYNMPPFGNGKGVGKGSYEEGIAQIKEYLPNRLEEAWKIAEAKSEHPENAGGYSCLVEMEEMSGKKRKFLLDTGWSYKWMDESFKREGIDTMLKNKEIEALFISHEHFDHYWGLPVTLKYDPEITIYLPEGFYDEGLQYIKDCGHKGEVHIVKNGLFEVAPGFATYVFPIPIICRVYGEQSLYFNVAGKGMVSVTGCCHQGILQFAETAHREISVENDNFHGIYGGLHVAPFDNWDPKNDDLVTALGKYGFERIGCNHCTGVLCAKKFIKAGYPVVGGSARFGSKDSAYLGNGDSITFG